MLRAGELHRILTLGLAGLSLALTAPASAQSPGVINLGPGFNPDVAVDEKGTAHFVWDAFDETMRYCRIPAGQSVCSPIVAIEDSDEPEDDQSSGPRVLTREPGEVYLISRRCCNDSARPGGERTSVLVSTDGGENFSSTLDATNRAPDGDAILGPGQFSFSQVPRSATQGIVYQAGPLAGGNEAGGANLSEGSPDGSFPNSGGTIGLVDSETPIAAMQSLEGNLYYRVFNSPGDPNNLGSWGPMIRLDAGSEPDLATGPRGVYLMNLNSGVGADSAYQVRKLDNATRSFAPPQGVTQRGKGPAFGDLHQDNGGNLHALWRDGDGNLQYRSSVDGTTFTAERTLANTTDDGDIANIDAGGGEDGKGWAVWEDGPTGSRGPLRAVPIDARAAAPGQSPPPGCVTKVDFGPATAFSIEGCFQRRGDRYTTTGPLRVNGATIMSASGGAVTTTIDRGDRTLKTSGTVRVSIERVILGEKRLDWELPAGSSGVADAFRSTERFGVRLLGFPVSGEAELVFKRGGRLELPANLKLPSFWDGRTARTVLKANNLGFDLASVSLDVPQFNLGLLDMLPFKVRYGGDNPFVFEGETELELPPLGTPSLKAGFRLEDGEFAEATGDLSFGPAGVPIVPPVFLQTIGFSIHALPKPAYLEGRAGLIAGPQIAGVAAVGVDGALRYTFPDPGPAVIEILAKVKVVGLEIGDGFIRYASNGVFSFGGQVVLDLAAVAVRGGFGGFIDIPESRFQISADVSVTVLGITAGGEFIASTKGIGTCAGLEDVPVPFPPFQVDIEAGFTWDYESFPTPMLFSCTLDDIREDRPPGSPRAAGAGRVITLEQRDRPAVIIVEGSGTAPRLRVTNPAGEAVESSEGGSMAGQGGNMTVMSLPEANRTFVQVTNPAAGDYRIDRLPNSAPIANVKHGYDPVPLRISGRVSGRGRGPRTLSYQVDGLEAGTTVEFAERGGAGSVPAGGIIGSARASRGTIRFRPAPGPGGRREITALVSRGDIPETNNGVTAYTAPGPPRPTRVRGIRAKLTGRRLRVTWGRSRDAREYRVRVGLRTDGRVVQMDTRRRSLTLNGVDAPDVATITVTGIRPVEGTAGRPAKTTVRLRKPQRKRRR